MCKLTIAEKRLDAEGLSDAVYMDVLESGTSFAEHDTNDNRQIEK